MISDFNKRGAEGANWGDYWHCYADNGDYEVITAADSYIAARCFTARIYKSSGLSIVGIFKDGRCDLGGICYAVNSDGNLIAL